MKRTKIPVLIFLSIILFLILTGIGLLIFGPEWIERSMNRVQPHAPYRISQHALKMHNKLIIMDWHSDSLLWGRDLLKRSDYGHVDIPRLLEGNVAIQMFTAVTKSPAEQNYQGNTGESDTITRLAIIQRWPFATWSSLLERALHQSHRLHEFASRAPDRLRIVRTRDDLIDSLKAGTEAKDKGEPGLVIGLLGIEGSHALEGRLKNVKVLYDAGYRMMSLHHFFDNRLGGSLHGISHDGLTDFGRVVIREMDALNIIIDVAHSSPSAVDDVLAITTRPIVISHTGVYGACKSPRNLADDQMRRIAEKGGLIAIGYWQGAVCDISPEGIVKSLRYAIDLVGEDHVALGSDFDGSTTTVFDASELSVLTQHLLDAGFTESEIVKVMGGNSVKFLLENLPR